MIYTVTFNPAIDYVVGLNELNLGEVNRTDSERMFFGGKGINVSIVLAELGIHSTALGFTAGFTGKAIEDGLSEMGIDTDFVRLSNGNSRINVKINSGVETEINGQGPNIDNIALDKLFQKLDKIQDGDTLVLAGSIPKTLPSDIYEIIMSKLSDKKIKVIVDASGDLLLNVLKYHPHLIKPNSHELGELFNVELTSDNDIIKYAKKLKEMGAENVLVSMAEKGALLLDSEGNIHKFGVCKGTVINSVGAGDSMLAGFIAGSANGDLEYALKLGTACGGATAFSYGLAKKDFIDSLLADFA
ncbi:MAG: 1-phosphofructokinase [Ruminococcus sp.]|nr:1-phosphofructokinase [Ruminococcus sp.]